MSKVSLARWEISSKREGNQAFSLENALQQGLASLFPVMPGERKSLERRQGEAGERSEDESFETTEFQERGTYTVLWQMVSEQSPRQVTSLQVRAPRILCVLRK